MKDKKLKLVLITSCSALYLIWTLIEVFIVPKMELQLSSEVVEIIKEVVIKIVVWFIPSMALSIHFNKFMYVKKQEFFTFKTEWLKFLPIFLIFAAYQVISSYVTNGSISISESFKASDILLAFTVGLSEEMFFRGWLLNSTLYEKRKWIPVLINAVLFLIIHFPIWFRSGLFIEYILSGSFIQIIILSIILSWSFIKSKSIIVPAALHIFWDLLCWLL